MDRRAFLGGTIAALSGVAGCLSSPEGPSGRTDSPDSATATATETPTATDRTPPDCEDPERPEPDSGSSPVEPATYPTRPQSLADEAAVAEYIEAYEAAYRRNALLQEQGAGLKSVAIGVGEPRFFESPPGSAIARVTYTFGYRVEVGYADSAPTHVSYYIDDSVLVRAERVGPLKDESELEPDSLTEGTVVECLD